MGADDTCILYWRNKSGIIVQNSGLSSVLDKKKSNKRDD